ncbi:MAG: site-specific DNA-methyltransferase [Ardenticatenales bacterium]|nr:site-specific DNA-methyltransferase [Ardenticatenales bacterium]
MVEFYQHDQHWSNRLILGDSLQVMASLAEKEGLKGKVQTIYLDPPYGIKFGSNWQVSTRKRDVKDGKVEDATRQPEQVRAFRDTWQLGIHSYLAYLRDRLVVARELLTETGSLFVQIGDENVHVVRSIMDEVFGSEHFVALVAFKKTTGAGSFAGGTNILASTADYIVWYAKNMEQVKYRPLYRQKDLDGIGGEQYTMVETSDGQRTRGIPSSVDDRPFRPDNLTSQTTREAQTTVFPVDLNGQTYLPNTGGWKTNRDGMTRLGHARRLIALGKTLCYVRFFDDYPLFPFTNVWTDTVTSGFADPKMYVVQTNAKVIERCLLMTTDPGDLVLDPTCGSGTTAYVAEQWGRRWITVDTSRVALALARTRIMSARYPYYLLADTPEGISKEAEVAGRVPPMPMPATGADVRRGFVYRRVPHITLKSIANNPDIVPGMTREQIDAAIARHADTETLYDKPYEDNKRVRVSGPFTVESLSPHRVLDTDTPQPASEAVGKRDGADFGTMILDNLRVAGVQNTRKGERLKFDRLAPYAGLWLQAAGAYTDTEGNVRRVAVSIGPEHGTVGPQHVKEAAKEAVKGVGFDLLIVCGFAFDPHVGEEAKRFGQLDVLPVRMNADLLMGDALLKKTGAGNLFMVFGEPDIDIRHLDGNMIEVELRGLDIYDPTTGALRTASTDEIACWFIDTDYDAESFFVRHAYFTGADEPYDKLRRALRAEVDEGAWGALYRTVSRGFARPKDGRKAVKVINHYGDEVLRVYDV